MLKSKLFQIIIAMLIVITLILTAFFILWNYMDKKNASDDPASSEKAATEAASKKKVTSAEVKELTYPKMEILTNLSEKNKVIKAAFAFELDNKKALTEFEELDFKIKGIINNTLADMTAEQLAGSKGQDALLAVLINKINSSVLTEGKLKQIWVTEWILQ